MTLARARVHASLHFLRCRSQRSICFGARGDSPNIDCIGLSASGLRDMQASRERPLIWIHAVSLGETRAAEPLIDALAAAVSAAPLLVDAHDADGSRGGRTNRCAHHRACAANLSSVRLAVRGAAFSARVSTGDWASVSKPRRGRISSPSLREQRIPMALVNARLSERSYRRSRRYASLMRETAARFSLALAQTRCRTQIEFDKSERKMSK